MLISGARISFKPLKSGTLVLMSGKTPWGLAYYSVQIWLANVEALEKNISTFFSLRVHWKPYISPLAASQKNLWWHEQYRQCSTETSGSIPKYQQLSWRSAKAESNQIGKAKEKEQQRLLQQEMNMGVESMRQQDSSSSFPPSDAWSKLSMTPY